MKRINVAFFRRNATFLLAALLLFLFGAIATKTTDAQEQFAKYKWRSGKVEDLSKSVQGFKWGMTQAQILKIMGRTDDRNEMVMAYSNRPVFGADGEVASTGDIVFFFTKGRLTNILINYKTAELFEASRQWFEAAFGEGTKGAGDDPTNFYWYTWRGDSIKIRMSNSFNQSMSINWISKSDASFAEE